MKSFFRLLIIVALIGALFYGYKIYKVNTLTPPDVWVDTGEVLTCIGCEKVLERNVKQIKVPGLEAKRYRIKYLAGICDSCRARGVE